MKATFVSKEENKVKFTMEFPAEEFEKAVIAVYQANKGKFQIDGFRKGKAPRSIIERHYGDDIFFEDAINNMLQSAYPEAVNELELEVIANPEIDFDEIKKGEAVNANITVEVYPEVEVKDYKGIEIENIASEVTDEDVEDEIEGIRRRNSRMVVVERPIEEGDTVLLDYTGTVDGVEFEGGSAERYPLKIGSNTFIPGFEEQLKGVSAGEDKDVVVTFPEEYHSEDLAGKEAVFACKIHEVKEQQIPDLDDEFVKDVSEWDTLDEFKEDTRKKLEERKQNQAQDQMKQKAIEAVCEANDIAVPEAMVMDEINDSLGRFDQQLQQQGLSLQQYMQYTGEDPQSFMDQYRPECEKRVKERMVVRAIAETENFEVTEEDIDAEMENMAKMYNMEKDKIKEILGDQNVSLMEKDLQMRKAIDFIFDNAVIKEKEETAEQENAEQEDAE